MGRVESRRFKSDWAPSRAVDLRSSFESQLLAVVLERRCDDGGSGFGSMARR